jgi:hypothetical protein
MSEIKIRRRSRDVPIVLHTSTALATTIRMEDFAGGVVEFGTMVTASVSLQMWGSSSETGPWRQLFKTDGSAATITLAPSTAVGRMYPLPDEVFAVPYLEIISGTTNSTGTSGIVSLKS